MPISSFGAANSIMKPGVCTSTTRPASPYDGQVVYETDTDRVVAYNGSVWQTINGGLQYITGASFNAVTSVSLPTNTFTSTYDNYKIYLAITGFSTGAYANMRMRTSGTDNTADAYRFASSGLTSTNSSADRTGDAGNTSFAYLTEANTEYADIEMTIYRPLNTSAVKSVSGTMLWSRSNAPYWWWKNYGGLINSSALFDAVTFYPSAGNFTGTYKVFGVVN